MGRHAVRITLKVFYLDVKNYCNIFKEDIVNFHIIFWGVMKKLKIANC